MSAYCSTADVPSVSSQCPLSANRRHQPTSTKGQISSPRSLRIRDRKKPKKSTFFVTTFDLQRRIQTHSSALRLLAATWVIEGLALLKAYGADFKREQE